MQINRCLKCSDYSLPTTAGTAVWDSPFCSQEIHCTNSQPGDPSVLSNISYRVTFNSLKVPAEENKSALENSVSLCQHDEVRVKHGTKNIWDHTGKIKWKKYLINEVNWGFSKSTIFVDFSFVFISIFNQRERKKKLFFLSSIKKSDDCATKCLQNQVSECGEPLP